MDYPDGVDEGYPLNGMRDPFDLLQRNVIARPVIKLCGRRRLMRRDRLGFLEGRRTSAKQLDAFLSHAAMAPAIYLRGPSICGLAREAARYKASRI